MAEEGRHAACRTLSKSLGSQDWGKFTAGVEKTRKRALSIVSEDVVDPVLWDYQVLLYWTS